LKTFKALRRIKSRNDGMMKTSDPFDGFDRLTAGWLRAFGSQQ
jgi:hypothetical protein